MRFSLPEVFLIGLCILADQIIYHRAQQSQNGMFLNHGSLLLMYGYLDMFDPNVDGILAQSGRESKQKHGHVSKTDAMAA